MVGITINSYSIAKRKWMTKREKTYLTRSTSDSEANKWLRIKNRFSVLAHFHHKIYFKNRKVWKVSTRVGSLFLTWQDQTGATYEYTVKRSSLPSTCWAKAGADFYSLLVHFGLPYEALHMLQMFPTKIYLYRYKVVELN